VVTSKNEGAHQINAGLTNLCSAGNRTLKKLDSYAPSWTCRSFHAAPSRLKAKNPQSSEGRGLQGIRSHLERR